MSTLAVSGNYSSPRAQALTGARRALSGDQRLAVLFDVIDKGGTGTISNAQFKDALKSMRIPKSMRGKTVDQLFAQLDTGGTGSVPKQDFISGMRKILEQGHSGYRSNNSVPDATPMSTETSDSGVDITA